MELLEPITRDDICDLEEGEWIWDNKLHFHRAFGRNIERREIRIPIGFREIQILDTELYPRYSSKPFMLSGSNHNGKGGCEWVHFEEGRFFRLRKE